MYQNYNYYYYVSAFVGIPYAMPPTGENRFQVRDEFILVSNLKKKNLILY